MVRKILFPKLAATLAVLLTTCEAKAWGCRHFGYTHIGPGGMQHWGRTSFSGPFGSYSGGHYGAYGRYGGSYHAGYGYGAHYGGGAYGGGYHYGASPYYGGYHYGGFGAASLYGAGYNAGYASGAYPYW